MSQTHKKAAFQWDDPLLLDQQLTEEERMVRESARAYCQERLEPVSYTHLTLPTTPYV